MKQRERDHWIVIISLLTLYLAVAILYHLLGRGVVRLP